MTNHVFIAMSLDGYIADRNNELEWLIKYPNEDKLDFGFNAFMDNIDALLMGRNTFEFVMEMDEWYYNKHVFVLSSTITSVPDHLQDKVTIVNGDLEEILSDLNNQGYKSLYIDGGKTIQSLLQLGVIDEITVNIVPVLLGGGYPLFGELDEKIDLKLLKSTTFSNGMIMHHYRVK